MAWLNTAPRDEKKQSLNSEQVAEPVTRLEKMQEDGIVPPMPILPATSYIEWLMDLGPADPEGAPIGWRTLQAWQECTGIRLQPWEAKLLRSLSGDWLAEKDRAKKPDCPAPWTHIVDSNREAVEHKIRAAFSGFALGPKTEGLRRG